MADKKAESSVNHWAGSREALRAALTAKRRADWTASRSAVTWVDLKAAMTAYYWAVKTACC